MDKMAKVLCKLFGHKPAKGELKRSPYTVYTHWQDTTCSRCGLHLSGERFYFDALTQPEMFASPIGKKPGRRPMAELVPTWIDDLRVKRAPEPGEPTIGEVGEYGTIRFVPSGSHVPPMTDREFADAFAEVMGDE